MSNIRVLATGLEFPEGPVVMPDGSIVLVEIRGRRLTRVWPDGRKEVVAEMPGGPNGAALAEVGEPEAATPVEHEVVRSPQIMFAAF